MGGLEGNPRLFLRRRSNFYMTKIRKGNKYPCPQIRRPCTMCGGRQRAERAICQKKHRHFYLVQIIRDKDIDSHLICTRKIGTISITIDFRNRLQFLKRYGSMYQPFPQKSTLEITSSYQICTSRFNMKKCFQNVVSNQQKYGFSYLKFCLELFLIKQLRNTLQAYIRMILILLRF